MNEPIQRKNIGGTRYYIVGGKPLPSVTSILSVISKPALVPWAAKMAAEEIERLLEPQIGQSLTRMMVAEACEQGRKAYSRASGEAADYGTRAHELISKELAGEKVEVPARMKPILASFWAFVKTRKLKLVRVEKEVYSQGIGVYAGTVDYIGRYPGGRYAVIDWKTGKGIYPEYVLQVAAYARATGETLGLDVSEGWIVRAHNRDGVLDVESYMVPDLAAALEGFLAAKILWESLRQVRQELALGG